MSQGSVSARVQGSVATVTLSRPPLNILNLEMMQSLHAALGSLSENPGVGVIVLRSALPGVFSAGADVREHLPESAERLITTFEGLVTGLISSRAVTVAVVDGKCLGGGMEVAMACDIVLATEGSTFGHPEVKVGVYPPAAAALYPKIAGLRNALRIVLTGGSVSATEAHSMGLVTEVAKEGELEARVEEISGSLGENSKKVMELSKRAVYQSLGEPAGEALRGSSRLYLGELMKTEDATEGLSAFLEKRKPSWKGR